MSILWISDLETTLTSDDIPIKIESHAHIFAAHYITFPTLHIHSDFFVQGK